KQLVVIARAFATLFGPTPEMAELDAEQPRLDCVEAIVEALDLVLVLACLAVVAQHPALYGDAFVIRRHCPGLAEGAQIFAGIEAECRRSAHRAGHTPAALPPGIIFRAVRLAGIFDDDQVVLTRH